MPSLPEVTVWTGASRAALAQAVLAELAGAVQPIGVGGPRHAAVQHLAKALACPCDDDPRRLVVDHPAAFLFLAGDIDISLPALAAAVAAATVVVHIDPLAQTLHDCRELALLLDDQHARFVSLPDLLHSTGWVRAADPLQAVGALRSLAYLRLDGGSAGALAASLDEAARLTIQFADLPTAIDANVAGASGTCDGKNAIASSHLTAHVRLPDGRAAVWIVSHVPSAAAAFDRSLQLIGDEGRLLLSDESYELTSHAAGLLDRLEPAAPLQRPSFAALIAHQWRQLIDRPALLPTPAPTRPGQAKRQAAMIACRQAALLSARSGQPENPGQLLATHGW